MPTEGGFQRSLADTQPDLGLEPLAVLGDQIDDRDRRVTDLGRQGGQVVKRRLTLGIEDVIGVKRLQAILVIDTVRGVGGHASA